jgi:hypothetical protein
LRIGFHFPWRNTVTRQLAHIFCTVAKVVPNIIEGKMAEAAQRLAHQPPRSERSERSGRLDALVMRHCGLGIATLPVPSRCLHTRVPAPSRALPCHSTARAISFSRLNAPHNGGHQPRRGAPAERRQMQERVRHQPTAPYQMPGMRR